MSEQRQASGAPRPVDRGGRHALLFAAGGLALSLALVPWGLLGLALEIAAVVVGVRAMRRARSSGGVAPGALAAVLVGGLASLFLLALLGFLSVFHAEFGDYRTCYGRAITESARAECRASFETAVRVRLGLP